MKCELLIATPEGTDVVGDIDFISLGEKYFTYKTFSIAVKND